MQRRAVPTLVAGGLCSGLLINVGEYVLNGALLHTEWGRFMDSIGHAPLGPTEIGKLTMMSFLLGGVTIWLHLPLRAHYTSWQRSALMAGGIAWFLAYGLGSGWAYAMGTYPANLYLPTLCWAAFEVPLATLAGAWICERLWLRPRIA